MRKLLLLVVLAFASCEQNELEDCNCVKSTYETLILTSRTAAGVPYDYFETTKILEEPVLCQEELEFIRPIKKGLTFTVICD